MPINIVSTGGPLSNSNISELSAIIIVNQKVASTYLTTCLMWCYPEQWIQIPHTSFRRSSWFYLQMDKEVYKNLHKFDGSGSLEGWVRRIISNNIKDEIRKNKIELHNAEYDISRIEVPVEDYKEPNVDEIIKVIPMLPPSYRKTFELYYMRGYSLREIADMLGVTESTSKTNLMKGRNIIKKYFKDNPQIDIN